jgi:hypothetical protein
MVSRAAVGVSLRDIQRQEAEARARSSKWRQAPPSGGSPGSSRSWGCTAAVINRESLLDIQSQEQVAQREQEDRQLLELAMALSLSELQLDVGGVGVTAGPLGVAEGVGAPAQPPPRRGKKPPRRSDDGGAAKPTKPSVAGSRSARASAAR